MYLYSGHSANASLEKGEGVNKESNKEWHRKEGVQSKKWCFSHKFFYVLFLVTQSLFLLGFSWSPDNIIASKKRAHRGYHCIWNNYIMFARKYYNSTNLSMWVFYTTCVSKNSVVYQDVIFYLIWYNVIRLSSRIRKKSSFLSF